MLRARRGIVLAPFALLLVAIAAPAAPVAATEAADEATLRAAWADPAETLIVLAADVTLGCAGAQPERVSATAIVVNGNGHALRQPCTGHDGLRATGGGAVTIRNLVLEGAGTNGDGIDADGAVTLQASAVSGHGGVGVRAAGPVSVSASVIDGNAGGGIDGGGEVTISLSAVTANGAVGIRTAADQDATIADTTVDGNALDGAEVGGDALVVRSTFAGNGFAAAGAGLLVGGAEARLVNSTLVDNAGVGAAATGSLDVVHGTLTGNATNAAAPSITLRGSVLVDATVGCAGPVTDAGHNLVDDATCAPVAASAADPLLGPLAMNGGPTPTRLPAPASALVDAIQPDECALTGDQRNVARPQGTGCEIGSVETGTAAPVPPPGPPATPAPSPTPAALPDTALPRRP